MSQLPTSLSLPRVHTPLRSRRPAQRGRREAMWNSRGCGVHRPWTQGTASESPFQRINILTQQHHSRGEACFLDTVPATHTRNGLGHRNGGRHQGLADWQGVCVEANRMGSEDEAGEEAVAGGQEAGMASTRSDENICDLQNPALWV